MGCFVMACFVMASFAMGSFTMASFAMGCFGRIYLGLFPSTVNNKKDIDTFIKNLADGFEIVRLVNDRIPNHEIE